MPKQLPKPLNTTLAQIDEMLRRHAETLAKTSDTKMSVADWIRLFQFRLELADRYEATNPRPTVAMWVEPAWAFEAAELPDAISALDLARKQYEEALKAAQTNAAAPPPPTEDEPQPQPDAA